MWKFCSRSQSFGQFIGLDGLIPLECSLLAIGEAQHDGDELVGRRALVFVRSPILSRSLICGSIGRHLFRRVSFWEGTRDFLQENFVVSGRGCGIAFVVQFACEVEMYRNLLRIDGDRLFPIGHGFLCMSRSQHQKSMIHQQVDVAR